MIQNLMGASERKAHNLIDTGISCVMTEAIPTGPEVSGGQTGVHNEQTVCISVTNYLPGVHNEQTV